MTTYPIVALGDGEVSDPQWFEDITDAVNDHQTRVSALESQVSTASVTNADTTARTTTSTSYTTTLSPANICGVAFVAPTSGSVMLCWKAEQAAGTGSAGSYTAGEVRQGTTVGAGTLVYTASDNDALSCLDSVASMFHHAGITHLLTGLTPGANYNVSLAHRMTTGTGTFQRREVDVIPLIA